MMLVRPAMYRRLQFALTTSLATLALLATAVRGQAECVDESIAIDGCDPNDKEACDKNCGLFGSSYLLDKCCIHSGVNANLLAFEESDTWIPRLEEYNRCTGANVRLQYVEGGEDNMQEALIDDVGENNDDSTGQGIYDAYIVQAVWIAPIFKGLKGLSKYIADNDEYINFLDINQASRSAVSYEGEVRALPLDTDYIAMGWRQDVFDNPTIREAYKNEFGEELKVPNTIEEMVIVSERLNGRHDYNNDGEMDWGFCLTPQTNYFNAFLSPVLQAHIRECEKLSDGTNKCVGADTGQNVFFDVNNMDPLIHNVSFTLPHFSYISSFTASDPLLQFILGGIPLRSGTLFKIHHGIQLPSANPRGGEV